MTAPQRLTVLYDQECPLCRRCRQWLETQRTYVAIDFLASGSEAATIRYDDVPWLGADLVVVSDSGDTWVGPAAFLVCLWATVEYRAWSFRLSGRFLSPLAEHFFHTVSKQRGRIGRALGEPDCPDGRCRHRGQEAAHTPLRWGARAPEFYVPPAERWMPPPRAGIDR